MSRLLEIDQTRLIDQQYMYRLYIRKLGSPVIKLNVKNLHELFE